MRTVVSVLSVMAVGLILSCRGYDGYGPQGPGGWGPMMHYGFGYGGMFMWILFLFVTGLLVYFFVQAQKTKGPMQRQTESPLDILRRRYAEGEISKEDFDRMKKDLES
jgi:putative membrane protein